MMMSTRYSDAEESTREVEVDFYILEGQMGRGN
jgi:hypothetical protein